MAKIKNQVLNKIIDAVEINYGKIEINKKAIDGGGPNSNVYRFKVADSKEEKVLKVLNPKLSKKDNYENEKKAMLECSCKEVIKFEITDIIAGTPFFVFPYISGDTIRKLIGKGKMNEDDVVKFAYKIIKIIEKLYTTNGVVHQDIKPANIIYKAYNNFKILDLGIALFSNQYPGLKKGKGPLHYLSPEMSALCIKRTYKNQCKVNYASDFYSLGLMSLEMILGARINKIIEVDKIHMIDEFINKLDLKKETKELLTSLLTHNPSDRLLKINKLQSGGTEEYNVSDDNTLWTVDVHNDKFNTYIKNVFLPSKIIGTQNLGLVLLGDVVQNDENLAKMLIEYQKDGLRIMVDPRTMRIRNDYRAYLENRAYYKSVLDKKKFIKEVIDFEKKFSPNFFIAPYSYVSSNNDQGLDECLEWFNTFITAEESIDNDNSYFGITIRNSLLHNHEQLKDVIDIINFNENIKKIYVLFETQMDSSAPNEDTESLAGIKMFIEMLGSRKEIFWSSSDITALFFLGNGLHNFSICPTYSCRKNNFDRFDKESGGGGAPAPKVFSPHLFNDILRDEELFKETSEGRPGDNELKFKGHFFNEDLKNGNISKSHFLEFIAIYREKIKNLDSKKIRSYFVDNLKEAQKMYDLVSEKYKIIFQPETDDSFVKVWQSILKD